MGRICRSVQMSIFEHIALRAAALAAAHIPILVAPTLPFGSSHHHLPFGATMSLSTEIYYKLVRELADSLITSGFRRIFILNGHGGNHELVQLVARDLALTHDADLGAGSYWSIAWEALKVLLGNESGSLPGHAGMFETSAILALHPQLVDEPRPHRDGSFATDPRAFAAPYRTELHGAWQRRAGFTDSPDRATVELGRQALSMIVDAVAEAFVEFYGAIEASTPNS